MRADAPSPKQSKPTVTVNTHESTGTDKLFAKEMLQQLDAIFSRMERPLLLKLYLENRIIAAELKSLVTALVAFSDKLELEVCDRQVQETFVPCVKVCLAGGDYTGKVYGPLFAFEDVNFYEMNVSGTDTVAGGMLFRIAGEIKGYSAEGGYIILEPVFMRAR